MFQWSLLVPLCSYALWMEISFHDLIVTVTLCWGSFDWISRICVEGPLRRFFMDFHPLQQGCYVLVSHWFMLIPLWCCYLHCFLGSIFNVQKLAEGSVLVLGSGQFCHLEYCCYCIYRSPVHWAVRLLAVDCHPMGSVAARGSLLLFECVWVVLLLPLFVISAVIPVSVIQIWAVCVVEMFIPSMDERMWYLKKVFALCNDMPLVPYMLVYTE